MNKIIVFVILIGTFLFSSCLMRKVEYVKNMVPDSLYHIHASTALRIQTSDRISIKVHAKNSELSAPFNTPLGGYKLTTEEELIKGVDADNTFEEGYEVDKNGYIDFPILGKIKVAGLTIEEIEMMIADLIITNNYIDEPLVKAQLLNFKVMTLGTINNKVIQVPSGKITLVEAIIEANGLLPNSDGSQVMVIREEGNDRKMIIVNMEQYDMFNSEGYYLQQNDIVYVAPKYKEVTTGARSIWQSIGMIFGVLSLGLSVYTVSTR